jgi:molecular chaperone HtpG
MTEQLAEERHGFQAEVSKILDIVANSLYSEKEVFLRELISNASDACDRLRYAALTQSELTADDPGFRIVIRADSKKKLLSVEDNGIGMNHDELTENLGTIARSGTSAFVQQLGDEPADNVALIGQFGVGFYSVFMVADSVTVTSRKAGEDTAWAWASDGKGEFTISPAERGARGTTIALHLKKGEKEFLEPERLRGIVKTYSDHIGLPIVLERDGEEETVNAASALWTRPRKDIGAEQYTEFYRHAGHAFDEPWLTIHNRVEGRIEYTTLLFIPSVKPFDLFDPARKNHLKLYVKRVFITDDCEGLVPPYLRFMRGIVDSEDLPLNISREMMQKNPLLARISKAVVKRVLSELEKKAEKAPEEYAKFWDNFGPVLKEGIYEDEEQRQRLLKLSRFRSTAADGPTSLDDYTGRMREGQEAIYYITGEDADSLAKSPQLEGFAARGVEVLLFADPVDAFWINVVESYDDKPLRPANRGGADLDKIALLEKEGDDETKDQPVEGAALGTLVALLKQNLGDAVADVRTSERLTDSAVCLVADDAGMDPHLERLLRQQNQLTAASPRILEINPRHALIRALAARAQIKGAVDALADASHLLLDQARIADGEPPADPAAFSRRLAEVMAQGIGG